MTDTLHTLHAWADQGWLRRLDSALAVMAQLREVGIGCVQGYAVHVPCPLDELAGAWDGAEPA